MDACAAAGINTEAIPSGLNIIFERAPSIVTSTTKDCKSGKADESAAKIAHIKGEDAVKPNPLPKGDYNAYRKLRESSLQNMPTHQGELSRHLNGLAKSPQSLMSRSSGAIGIAPQGHSKTSISSSVSQRVGSLQGSSNTKAMFRSNHSKQLPAQAGQLIRQGLDAHDRGIFPTALRRCPPQWLGVDDGCENGWSRPLRLSRPMARDDEQD